MFSIIMRFFKAIPLILLVVHVRSGQKKSGGGGGGDNLKSKHGKFLVLLGVRSGQKNKKRGGGVKKVSMEFFGTSIEHFLSLSALHHYVTFQEILLIHLLGSDKKNLTNCNKK